MGKRKSPTTKGGGGGSGKPTPRKRKKPRLEEFVAAQKSAMDAFSTFTTEVADLTMKGDFKPKSWAEKYTELWSDLADQMGKITKTLFKD